MDIQTPQTAVLKHPIFNSVGVLQFGATLVSTPLQVMIISTLIALIVYELQNLRRKGVKIFIISCVSEVFQSTTSLYAHRSPLGKELKQERNLRARKKKEKQKQRERRGKGGRNQENKIKGRKAAEGGKKETRSKKERKGMVKE